MERLIGWLERSVPHADDDAGATRISHGDFRRALPPRPVGRGGARARPGFLACMQAPGRAARRISGHARLSAGWSGGPHAGWSLVGLCALLGHMANLTLTPP